jgi:hypothetical protein
MSGGRKGSQGGGLPDATQAPVSPANKRKYTVIVVGTGLAGGAAAASLGELGYNVLNFCIQDSPRRAHSVAAQGGINAAKNYQNDGDSVHGGCSTTRSRAATSAPARPTCTGWPSSASTSSTSASPRACPSRANTAACWPTAPSAAPRSPAPSTRAARPASSCCSGLLQRLMRQVERRPGQAVPPPRDAGAGAGRRQGPRHRLPQPGQRAIELRRRRGDRGHRRLLHRVLPLHQRGQLQRHRHLALPRKGALFANPCFTQIHPTCIPLAGESQSKLTLMSESLRNDGRVWVPKKQGRHPAARPDSRGRARLLPGAHLSRLRQPGPARHRRRAAKRCATPAMAWAPPATRSTWISPTPSSGWAPDGLRALRQPVRDVRGDHGRRSLSHADAHLSRAALHDGRAVGGLQPHEHHPRPARAGRGQLLRPRRQPPGRQRADAGPGRRLLRDPVHARPLPGLQRRAGQEGHHRPPAFKAAEAGVAAQTKNFLSG